MVTEVKNLMQMLTFTVLLGKIKPLQEGYVILQEMILQQIF